MAARAVGIFGLFIAMALLIVAWHDKLIVAVADLFFATLALYFAIMLLRFPDRLRSFVSAGFSKSQMMFIWSIPIALLGLNIILSAMLFQYSTDITEFRGPLLFAAGILPNLYKHQRKQKLSRP